MKPPKLSTDATHARGCSKTEARPSVMLEGYDYCPECKRMVREEGGRG